MIKKFKDSLTNLKPILKEIEEIEVIRKLEIEQIKKTTKKKELKELGIEKMDELKKLDENLRFRETIHEFQRRSDSSDEEGKIELEE